MRHSILCSGKNLRPVMAKTRNSVFQIIFNYFQKQDWRNEPLAFLDLFSGSGLMAVEAVSRGFARAVAVEKDPGKWKTIKENFAIESNAFTLIRSPAERFLLRNRSAFDAIYIDPPFIYRYKNDLLRRISKSSVVHSQSLIIIHAPTQETLLFNTEELQNIDKRKYGGSTVGFYILQQ